MPDSIALSAGILFYRDKFYFKISSNISHKYINMGIR